MKNRVLILRWAGSAYDSLGGLLELMGNELRALGLTVVTVSIDEADWINRLIPVLEAGDIAFALTMSGIGVDLMVEGKLIWETASVPLFNWSCDHPCYFPARHAVRNPFLLYGYVFPDHARYHVRHICPNGSAFAVHIGTPSRALFPNAPMPLASRNGRILFAKSGADTNQIAATWRVYGPVMRQILFAGAEELFGGSTVDFLPVVQRIAESQGFFLHGDSRLALQMIREIDDYVRTKRANLVMNAILRYPVDVFGSGWDHIDHEGAGAIFHGATTWRKMIDRLPFHIGCLSINPLVQGSAHDRVFFALAAGVAPVSDGNDFIRTQMPILAPYCFEFTRERIEQALDAVLAQPDEAVVRTHDAWQNVATPFGMRNAARQIVQIVMLQSLNARSANDV